MYYFILILTLWVNYWCYFSFTNVAAEEYRGLGNCLRSYLFKLWQVFEPSSCNSSSIFFRVILPLSSKSWRNPLRVTEWGDLPGFCLNHTQKEGLLNPWIWELFSFSAHVVLFYTLSSGVWPFLLANPLFFFPTFWLISTVLLRCSSCRKYFLIPPTFPPPWVR